MRISHNIYKFLILYDSVINFHVMFILFIVLCSGNTGQRPYTHGEACSACPENQTNCVQNLCSRESNGDMTVSPISTTMEQTTTSTTTMADHQTTTQMPTLPANNQSTTSPSSDQATTMTTVTSTENTTTAFNQTASHTASTSTAHKHTTAMAYEQTTISPLFSQTTTITMATKAINLTAASPTVTPTITYNQTAHSPTTPDSLSPILYSVTAIVVVPCLIVTIILTMSVVLWRKRKAKAIRAESLSKENLNLSYGQTPGNLNMSKKQ